LETKLSNYIVQLNAFFLFSGYYVGLIAILAFFGGEMSRFYSIPLRLLLVISLLFGIRLNNSKLNLSELIIIGFTFLYILKIFISEAFNANLSKAWYEYVFYYLAFCLFPYLFFGGLKHINIRKHFFHIVMFSGILMCVATIFLYREFIFSGVGRLTNSTVDNLSTVSPLSLAYGAALNLSLIFCYISDLKWKNINFKVYILINLILSLFIFFIGSTRGALLALALSLLYLLITRKGISKVKYLISGVFLAPVLVYLFNLSGSNLLERTQSSIDKGDNSGRDSLWNDAWIEFLNSPFFGGDIEVSGIYPHNLFLEILMATGFLGLFIFLISISITLINFSKIQSVNKHMIFVLFINSFCQHMFSGALWSAILVFVSLGLMNYNVKQKYEIK